MKHDIKHTSIKAQLQQHSIAILSLVIALVALCYTTWREEATEHNRNTRMAAFEVLKNLGELQIIVNQIIYEPNTPGASPFLGWGHIAIISDMGSLLPPPIPEKTASLAKVWGETWQNLQKDEKAQDSLSAEIDSNRRAVLDVIHSLR